MYSDNHGPPKFRRNERDDDRDNRYSSSNDYSRRDNHRRDERGYEDREERRAPRREGGQSNRFESDDRNRRNNQHDDRADDAFGSRGYSKYGNDTRRSDDVRSSRSRDDNSRFDERRERGGEQPRYNSERGSQKYGGERESYEQRRTNNFESDRDSNSRRYNNDRDDRQSGRDREREGNGFQRDYDRKGFPPSNRQEERSSNGHRYQSDRHDNRSSYNDSNSRSYGGGGFGDRFSQNNDRRESRFDDRNDGGRREGRDNYNSSYSNRQQYGQTQGAGFGDSNHYEGSNRGGSFNRERTNHSSGFQNHSFQNSGGFGVEASDGRPAFNDQYGNRGEEQKEKAPRDWMPLEESMEKMMRDTREIAQILHENEDQKLEIRNSDIDTELTSWENSGLHPMVLRNIQECGYIKPRPIQSAVIPQLMNGYDLIGQAETGGGKTAAFGLPIVDRLLRIPQSERDSAGRESAPYCIILAPTRELAKQIFENMKMYTKGTGILVQLSYGEMNRSACLNNIRNGCHILVGTCGRIMDYILRNEIKMLNIKFFVLDEADRLLDDVRRGSGSHLSSIMEREDFKENPDKQTLLFSATFNAEVERIASNFMKPARGMKDIVRIVLSQGRLNPRVQLHFIEANDVKTKNEELEKLLNEKIGGKTPRTLVFVEQKKRTDFVAMQLCKKQINAQSINGDRPQNIREQTLAEFRSGKTEVLVGTDVCSRGLDINDLDRVINYDLPKGTVDSAIDTFIHRVGRTGRLKNGDAYSLINIHEPNDSALIPALKELVVSLNREHTLPAFMNGGRGGNGRSNGEPSGFNVTTPTGFSAPTGGFSVNTSSGFGQPTKSFGQAGFTMKKHEETNKETEKVEEDLEEEW